MKQSVKTKPPAEKTPMAVLLRDLPAGCNWGWYSREEPRMHLQTVDRKNLNLYKVWLEREGRRVFEPADKIPAKILKRLEAEVHKKRDHLDGRWVDFMIDNCWLEHRLAGTRVTLIAYPDTPNRFTRTLDLADYFRPAALAEIGPDDLTLNSELAALEIWPDRPEPRRHHIRLAPILWEG